MSNVVVPMCLDSNLVHQTTKFVSAVRQHTSFNQSSDIELKITIHVTNGDFFEELHDMITKYDQWKRMDNWTETVICNYTNSHGVSCKTISTSMKNCMIVPLFDSVLVQTDLNSASLIELSCVQLKNIDKNNLTCVMPSSACVQFERVFCTDKWKFKLVKYWKAPTLKTAFRSSESTLPHQKVEVSCLYPFKYFSKHTDKYVAVSLLLKICSVFSSEGNLKMESSC